MNVSMKQAFNFGKCILREVEQSFNITDIFDIDKILEFVKDNFNVEDIFSNTEIMIYVKYHLKVDAVFSEDQLGEWALTHGYVKEEK